MVAAGPWVRNFWEMLDLPKTIKIKKPDGSFTDDLKMWSYMALEEGELDVDPYSYKTAKGTEYPVIHVDTEATLISDKNGHVIHENEMWGFYYKPDIYRAESQALHLDVQTRSSKLYSSMERIQMNSNPENLLKISSLQL